MNDRPLVLVSLGTDHHGFGRLVEWVDSWAAAHPEVRVLVQHGASPAPRIAQGVRFLRREELDRAMARALVVVSHGGPATIIEARRHGHLPIVVARDPALGEHVDDHQIRFAARLDSAAIVRYCTSAQELATTLDKALAQPDEFRLRVGDDTPGITSARRAGFLIDVLTGHRSVPPMAGGIPPQLGTANRDGKPSVIPRPREHLQPTYSGEWPEVTVVVPTRGRPALLRRTLRSITEQDYPGRIVTLVVYDQDDPDYTLSDDSGDRPTLVLGNVLAPGLAGARNTGILAAESELVAFCDDDDMWLPHKLRTQVTVMRADPGTDLVCCGIRVAYDSTEAARVLDRTMVGFRDLLRSRLAELHPSTFLFRRDSLVHGCGLVSEEIPGGYGEDYELLLRVARTGTVRNVPEPGVRVLWHDHSHFSGRWQTISVSLRWLLTEYPEFQLVRPGYARVAGQVAFAEAAAGHRITALRWITATLRARPLEVRGYLALAVLCGLPAEAVVRALHRKGRGL